MEEKTCEVVQYEALRGFLGVNVKGRIRSNSMMEKSGKGTSLMQMVAQNIMKELE